MANRGVRTVVKLMTAVLLWGLIQPAIVAQAATEGSHWAFGIMEKWKQEGIVKGYADGSMKPDREMSRAEFSALVVRLMGYVEESETAYSDVASNVWHAKAIARATAAGVMQGHEGRFNPDAPISRQEAAVVLAKMFLLEAKDEAALDMFADASQSADWSRPALAALIESGYMTGYAENRLQPTRNVTRAEAIALIDKSAGQLRARPGTYTGNSPGNVVVNTSDVVLQNMTVNGDLFLTQGIGDGEVRLDNVVVKGRTIIQGGGTNSIVVLNSELQGLVHIRKPDGRVRVVAQGFSRIPFVQVHSGVTLEDLTPEKSGFGRMDIVDAVEGQTVQLDGDFEQVELLSPVHLAIRGGTVGRLIASEPSTVHIYAGTVRELTASASVHATGNGEIGTVHVLASGVQIEQQPKKVNVASGLSAVIAGITIVPPSSGSFSGGGTGSVGGNPSNTGDKVILNGIKASVLDGLPKETIMSRWDIAWGGTPTQSFFNLSGEPGPDDVIWRGGKTSNSAFADAVWGLIMNVYEEQDDDEPGAFIYNKTDVSEQAKTLQIIARANPRDGTHLSGRGAVRVKAAYKENGQYEVVTLQPQLSEAQLEDDAASFALNANGWITYEAPPLAGYSDSFSFDIGPLAGRTNVIFFIESNDRVEADASLGDRAIIMAVRILEENVGPRLIMGLTQAQLRDIPKETDLRRWDIAWGPTPVEAFFGFTSPASDAVIWRGEASASSSFGNAGYGLIMDTLEEQFDDAAGAFIYNKTDVAMNASKLQIIARSSNADAVVSGRGAIRVQAAYTYNGRYVVTTLKPELTESQMLDDEAQFEVASDGWVTFEAPPSVDESDSFFFNLLPLAGRSDVIFFVEANDRMEAGSNLTDRVIILATRVQSAVLEGPAQMIDTVYPTEEIVIADAVAEPAHYAVDPTGQQDSTAGIRQALLDVYGAGGGTVYLPVGTYRITGNITIPPFTALRGDYNDPDLPGFNGEYGTMIYADVASRDTNFPSLFTVGGSAAVIDITVYYPNQDAGHIKPYPYTFEIPSFAGQFAHGDHMAPTIRNVTMINAYRGIAASITSKDDLISAANEMLHLENVKGTVLYRGAELFNSSEYGVVRDISFGNRYWAEAPNALDPPLKSQLDAFTLAHGIGMHLGDLEWVQFTDISLADYRIGVRLYDGLRRHIAGQPEIYFIGQFHRLQVTNAVTGVRIDNMYPDFGVTFADSYIEGSLYAIRNEDQTPSIVKLIATELNGDVGGSKIVQTGGESDYLDMKADGELPNTAAPVPVVPPRRLFNAATEYGADRTGASDSAVAIQAALDAAEQAGGGIVYLPAGFYKTGSALRVPAHTELRGSAASAQRDQIGLSRGTVLFADYGYMQDEATAATEEALITLSGEAAGLRGLRIFYPDNEPNTVTGAVRPHAYTIRGTADHTYVTHVSLAGSVHGIQFKGTAAKPLAAPIVRGVSGTYYRVGISLEHTTGGYIEEALANATVVARSGLGILFPSLIPASWPSDENGKLARLYDAITRPNTVFIQTNHASNLTIGNSFTFGSHTFLQAADSSVAVFNSAGDNLQPATGKLFDMTDSQLVGVNIMRFQGTGLSADNSVVHLFNRLSLRDIHEWNMVLGVTVPSSTLASVVKPGDDLPAAYTYLPPYIVLNNISNATLDTLPGETNLTRWDIPWGGTPTGTFFDLNNTAAGQAVIWRGGKTENSAFSDAGWGLIMNAYEQQDDDLPGTFIYNKTDVAAGATKLQMIARSNPADTFLSGRGAFRVQAAYRQESGHYIVAPLVAELTEAQLSDSSASFEQNAEGWVTFEAPPTADVSDSFLFDISALAGKPEVIFFVESNDRMEAGTNLADRVIILAIRLQ
jgi:hypothetical protein